MLTPNKRCLLAARRLAPTMQQQAAIIDIEGASLAADREITEAAARVIEAHQRYCEALADLLIWANE